MNVLENCIIFLASVAGVLFNENTNFISFHERILSGYSEINRFIKQTNTYSSKINKNTLKKAGLKAGLKVQECFETPTSFCK